MEEWSGVAKCESHIVMFLILLIIARLKELSFNV